MPDELSHLVDDLATIRRRQEILIRSCRHILDDLERDLVDGRDEDDRGVER